MSIWRNRRSPPCIYTAGFPACKPIHVTIAVNIFLELDPEIRPETQRHTHDAGRCLHGSNASAAVDCLLTAAATCVYAQPISIGAL